MYGHREMVVDMEIIVIAMAIPEAFTLSRSALPQSINSRHGMLKNVPRHSLPLTRVELIQIKKL